MVGCNWEVSISEHGSGAYAGKGFMLYFWLSLPHLGQAVRDGNSHPALQSTKTMVRLLWPRVVLRLKDCHPIWVSSFIFFVCVLFYNGGQEP